MTAFATRRFDAHRDALPATEPAETAHELGPGHDDTIGHGCPIVKEPITRGASGALS